MILQGDCLEELKKLPDNSVDSVVTDPPYGISFMGKKWDYDVPSVEVWKEVKRVLKPGGHALVACGTRTQHRMAVNLEDAGFEIRDIVAWIYGSGFPKSLNIGKAVDKLQGNEREDCGIKTYAGPSGNNRNFGVGNTNEGNDKRKLTKGNSPYEGWGTALKPSMELWTLCRKPLEESTVAQNVLKFGTGGINIDQCRVAGEMGKDRALGKPRIDTDKYGKANPTLNPQSPLGRFPANLIHDGSDEVVGMFPNSKAGKNKTEKGIGGIWAKGTNLPCGPEYGDDGSAARFFMTCKHTLKRDNMSVCKHISANIVARYLMTILATPDPSAPSNVGGLQDEQLAQNVRSVVSGCDLCETLIVQELVRIKNLASSPGGLQVMRDFTGNSKNSIQHQNLASLVEEWVSTGITPTTTNLLKLFGYVLLATDENTNSERKDAVEENGEPKRFLYCAKASKSERNKGLEGFEIKQKVFNGQSDISSKDLKDVEERFTTQPSANFHPTVKPVSLMQYLCRLITPPKGIVLDPFMGSGTTGIGAKLEGFDFIGIERESEYVKIAEARIAAWEPEPQAKLL